MAPSGARTLPRPWWKRGYVPDIRTAFDLYISRNGPAYVERYKLTPIEAIAAIRSVGGLACPGASPGGTWAVSR